MALGMRHWLAGLALLLTGFVAGAASWRLVRAEPAPLRLRSSAAPRQSFFAARAIAQRLGAGECVEPPEPPSLPVPEEVLARVTAPTGRLLLRCVPACDEVYLRGKPIGRTAKFDRELPVGDYALVLRWGTVTKVVRVSIGAGETTAREAMRSGSSATVRDLNVAGRLAASCVPECDSIEVDGESYGSPIVSLDLSPGEHVVVLRRGAQQRRRTIRVEPGESTRVREDFDLPPGCDPPWIRDARGALRFKSACRALRGKKSVRDPSRAPR